MPAVAAPSRRAASALRRGPMRRTRRPASALAEPAAPSTAATIGAHRRVRRAAGRRDGGTLKAAIADNPDHLDTGLSYATEGWEIARGDRQRPADVQEGEPAAPARRSCPTSPSAMPKVSDGGRRTASRCARACASRRRSTASGASRRDIKFSIERLFRIDSGGVGFYTGIVGRRTRTPRRKKGGITGIVANDADAHDRRST